MWGYVIAVLVTALISYFATSKLSAPKRLSEEEAIRIASNKAEEIILEAEKKVLEDKKILEEKAKEVRDRLDNQEQQLLKRDSLLNERSSQLDNREAQFSKQEEEVKTQLAELKNGRERLQNALEKVAQLTKEEAQKRLLSELEADLSQSMAKKIKIATNKAEVEAAEKAKHILVESMQGVATEFVAETTTTTIELPDEKLKGRIIGKEGRNIRAFEAATGVDVIVDESPVHVSLSCFDPLRREIAALTMHQLVKDGRIHPGRIEEIVIKVKKEIAQEVMKNGEMLAQEAEWTDLPSDVVKLLGKMKYRTSYGQSLLEHTLEVMKIGEQLALELKADVSLVKKACLLHDIGKLLTQKISKPHHHISGDLARKYGFPEKLVNAIESHHGDIEPQSIESVIVSIADAISGARPGARKESYESYIKRIQALEELTQQVGKNKVKEVYAIHAGREIRVIVKPENAKDSDIIVLAQKIARKIEETQTYPGTIQVTVVRETRAIDTAK